MSDVAESKFGYMPIRSPAVIGRNRHDLVLKGEEKNQGYPG